MDPSHSRTRFGGHSPGRLVASKPPGPEQEPAGAYLKSIAIEGFRGIGTPARAAAVPGAGSHPGCRTQRLRQVELRRGVGASSHRRQPALGDPNQGLARGLAEPPSPWTDDVGGRALRRRPAGCRFASLASGRPGATSQRGTTVRRCAEMGLATTLAELGWDVALSRYRPFLSYAELGEMFDELATMYDALAAILGLGEVEALADSLRAARLDRERAFKEFKGSRDGLPGTASTGAQTSGPSPRRGRFGRRRPTSTRSSSRSRDWSKERIPPGSLEQLRRLARLAPPEEARVEDAIAGPRGVHRSDSTS